MYPFYDEDYYYNNYNYQPNNNYQLLPRQRNKITIQKSLHYASRTVNTLNQVIPLIYQIRPIITNTKNAFKIMQAMNHINDIDLDEVEQSIHDIKDNDVTFENMV